MDILILVIGIFLLWKLRHLISLIINKFTRTTEDGLSTYSHDIGIMNAKKRIAQADEINQIKSENDKLYSNKDIEDLLSNNESNQN